MMSCYSFVTAGVIECVPPHLAAVTLTCLLADRGLAGHNVAHGHEGRVPKGSGLGRGRAGLSDVRIAVLCTALNTAHALTD